MVHPLKCKKCGDYRFIEFAGVNFNDADSNKGFGIRIPFYLCKNCGDRESILPGDSFMKFRDEMIDEIKEGEFLDIPLKYVFSKLDSEKRFKRYDHLGFQYDPLDYYIIPGLYRPEDDGYLTPVFFDKDLLIYYNGHPDYAVKFTSFSSCNIYFKGEPLFSWGFGINRNGKLFKWLGDLDEDFRDEDMKLHLKRFQASNVQSDHEVFSKFYLSQNPYSPDDAFQNSDNETRLFYLKNQFNSEIRDKFGIDLAKVDVSKLSEYYKPPIMEEREQVFSAFLSLNKYFVENIQDQSLREILKKSGLTDEELVNKEGRKLGSLKLLSLFIERVLLKNGTDTLIAPLFVLNDLRQLHGHLSDSSFIKKYNSCKQRLGLQESATDLEVFKALVKKLNEFYKSIIDKKDVD